MRLDAYLKLAGKTPTGFARELGVSHTTIIRILNGQRRPGIDLLAKMVARTGGAVGLDDFVDQEFHHEAVPLVG